MTLADAIAPLSVDVFSRSYLGKKWIMQAGSADKYGSLLSWDELNRALEQLRLSPASRRVKLVRNGVPVAPDTYLAPPEGNHGSTLDGQRFQDALADGATLVLNHVQDLFTPVRALTMAVQSDLQSKVNANLYAGWRTQKGFDLHWDPHDTLVLQLIGRKRWTVYEPTRLHPLDDDVAVSTSPSAPAVWSGTLEQGSYLYMPRGWWHVAEPLDEPSVHVTLGVLAPRGDEFLQWIAHELKALADVRGSIPFYDGEEERAEYCKRLGSALAAICAPDALERYRQHELSKLPRRAPLTLATIARPAQPTALSPGTRVRLARGTFVSVVAEADGHAVCVAGARQFKVLAALVPALHLLDSSAERTIAELCAGLAPAGRAAMRACVLDLMVAGSLTASASADSSAGVTV